MPVCNVRGIRNPLQRDGNHREAFHLGLRPRSLRPLPHAIKPLCLADQAHLQMKIPRRFRLVDHALDPDAIGAIRYPPVDGVAFLVAEDRGADA